MLRDRLEIGVEVPAIQKCLLAESKLTLKIAAEYSLPKQSMHGVVQAGKKGMPAKPVVCYRCDQKSLKPTSCPLIRKPSATNGGRWDTSRKCADKEVNKLLSHHKCLKQEERH